MPPAEERAERLPDVSFLALMLIGENGVYGGNGKTQRNGAAENILYKTFSVSPFLRVDPVPSVLSVIS